MSKFSVNFAGLHFASPLVASAGTAGYGSDLAAIAPVDAFGGITTKTVTPIPWKGADFPRVCETECGLLNAIGLQNDGIEKLIKVHLPNLLDAKHNVIVSIAANTVKEFALLTNDLAEQDRVDAIELNVSCPNTDYGGESFASNTKLLDEVVSACAANKGRKPLVVKLSPHVNSIAETSKVAELAGADGLTISNTLRGLKIDVVSGKAMLGNVIGGYSGSGIKPIVLAMVYEAAAAVKIPIIGIGGVKTGGDVAEYIMAGATLVGIGTATLVQANASKRILEELKKVLKKKKMDVSDLMGNFSLANDQQNG